MPPSLVLEPPARDNWLHEIKYDGYRTVVVVDAGSAQAFTRNHHDWTDCYGRSSRPRLDCAADRRCSMGR